MAIDLGSRLQPVSRNASDQPSQSGSPDIPSFSNIVATHHSTEIKVESEEQEETRKVESYSQEDPRTDESYTQEEPRTVESYTQEEQREVESYTQEEHR